MNERQPNRVTDETGEHARGTAPPTTPGKAEEPEHPTGDKNERTTNTRDNRKDTHRTVNTVLAAVQALATVAIVVITYFYTTYAGQQSDAAIKAANAAKSSADNVVASERAFINFKGIDVAQRLLTTDLKTILALSIGTVWENSGTTPTIAAQSHVNFRLWPDELTDFADVAANVDDRPFALGPKADATISLPVALSNFEAIMNRTGRLYMWGWTVYRDIFDGTPLRLTEYCVELVQLQRVQAGLTLPLNAHDTTAEPQIVYNSCKSHNCYDEHCPDYQERTKGK